MKPVSRMVVGSALVALFLAAGSAEAIQLEFAGLAGSYIQFTPGGTITFEDEVPGSFNDFHVTFSDGVGDSVGLTGDIDGVFDMAPISTIGVLQSAAVGGAGELAIDDGVGSIFTADLEFIDVTTFFNFGFFNLNGVVNLMNLAYAGSNADLAGLTGSSDSVFQASFAAPVGETLNSLVTGAVKVGNYSGTIAGSGASVNAPEPSAALCFAVGSLVGGAACRRPSRGPNVR